MKISIKLEKEDIKKFFEKDNFEWERGLLEVSYDSWNDLNGWSDWAIKQEKKDSIKKSKKRFFESKNVSFKEMFGVSIFLLDEDDKNIFYEAYEKLYSKVKENKNISTEELVAVL